MTYPGRLRNPDGMVPFWLWNGHQEKEEISRQLNLAAHAGLRGMCLHARLGNQVEYMSDHWLELVKHACQKAKELGLEIWLYDEEGFPSGSAGGRLCTKDSPYRQRSLTFRECCASEAGGALRIFRMDDLTVPAEKKSLQPHEKVLAFFPTSVDDYVDTLSQATARAFMDMTHRKYYVALEQFFGSVIPVIYTDDLNHLMDFAHDTQLSWTTGFDQEFQKRNRYSILDHLSMLVEDLPGCAKVRIDYRKTVRDLFLQNFVKPMQQWCSEHGVMLVGHLSGDEGPFSKMMRRFSDPMTYYMTEDVPSIDDFIAGVPDGRYLAAPVNKKGSSMFILCKTASSVAHQFKNDLCSSEVLTSLGWGVPFVEQLAQLNINMALGMNMITPHAYSYTAEAIAKRDHPASYFYQQPYFKFHRELYACVSNSLRHLQKGEPETDLLIIYPVSSLWASTGMDSMIWEQKQRFRNSDLKDPDTAYRILSELLLQLERQHKSYEFGHEEMMVSHGIIQDSCFHLGKSVFREIVLPDLVNISKDLVELLRNFTQAGGRVTFIGSLPTLINGKKEHKDLSFIVPFVSQPEQLPFRAENLTEILLHRRIVQGEKEYFLVNFTGTDQTIDVTEKGYYLYDPCGDSNEGTHFMLHHGHACHILRGETNSKDEISGEKMLIQTSWHIVRQNSNTAMFDYAETPDGTCHYFGEFSCVTAGTSLTTRFVLPELKGQVWLWSENAQIQVNGSEIIHFSKKHEANNALNGAEVSGLLHAGENSIIAISTGKRPEMFYLSGDFKVQLQDHSFEIQPPDELQFGDCVVQGLPFYWGTVKYHTVFQGKNGLGRINLSGDGIVRISVNEKNLPLAVTLPDSRDFEIVNGENTITLTLANTAQNFFGNHREFALTEEDFHDGECKMFTAWRPPAMGTNRDSFSLASFGLQQPIIEIYMDRGLTASRIFRDRLKKHGELTR